MIERTRPGRATTAAAAALLAAGCANDSARTAPVPDAAQAPARLVTYTETRAPCRDYRPHRRALFGDLHVHTAYSFDAVANSVETYPHDAHRFARGEAIPFFPLDAEGRPAGSVRIDRPLDFVAVTDHGEFLGERALCRTPGSPRYDSEFCAAYRSSERTGMVMLGTIVNAENPQRVPQLCGADGALCREFAKGPWQEMIDAAEAFYDRSAACRFTSFVGYEYTGTPGLSNIHRNVIFRNARVPPLPVSYVEAPRYDQLWSELTRQCGADCEWITIPHNSNLANGRMFALLEPAGHGHDHGAGHGHDHDRDARERALAEQRLRNEPVIEIFQHKGNSECMNGLSTVFGRPDEHCEFEAVRRFGERRQVIDIALVDGELRQGSREVLTDECGDGTGSGGMVGGGCVHESDFHRSNLLRGLRDEQRLGINTARLGVIASTDTHASTPGAVAEDDWGGHVSVEATPEERLQPGLLTSGIVGNPGGLAGVWAVENSRDAIFEALQRREVFGTSGPRIEPRLFAGWGYDASLCDDADWLARAYRDGVPMGGDLVLHGARRPPTLLVHALADPEDAPLERLQIVKGWVTREGEAHYEVIDVAGEPGTGRARLCAVYRDDAFDPTRPAYYYLRVLQTPTERWSAFDCAAIPETARPPVCAADSKVPRRIQEMAWSSPVWYRPQELVAE